ncbi:putative reverse transcriptase domain-containing protein [Tanacetum coccineum]
MKKTDSIEKLAQLYLKEIMCRHGVPVSVISDRDSLFTSRFWVSLQKARWGHQWTYYRLPPGHGGQCKGQIQTLEDMLSGIVIDFGSTLWPLPIEALYGRKCSPPQFVGVRWGKPTTGPELVLETNGKDCSNQESGFIYCQMRCRQKS